MKGILPDTEPKMGEENLLLITENFSNPVGKGTGQTRYFEVKTLQRNPASVV